MSKQFSMLLAAGVAAVLIYGCTSGNGAAKTGNYLDLSGVDSTVQPSDNFFQFANGTWMKNTEIPASKTGWGSFYIVRDNALTQMREILDSCMNLKDLKKGSIEQQIGDLYASGMDSSAVEQAGIQPLKAELDRISAVKDAAGILDEIAEEYNNGDGALFSFYGSPDDKNSMWQMAHFDQGGLGLPNRDYYFKADDNSKKIRDAYVQYITKILTLSGTDSVSAAKKAAGIMTLETALAKVSKNPVELRDPEANYHKLTLGELDKMTPNFNWTNLLGKLNVKQDTVLVGQPDFYKGLNTLLKSTPLNVWKDYLQYHLVSGYANVLSSPFYNARFDFYNRLLNGQKQPEERWKRMCSLVDGSLGDALGQLYVQRFFPPSAKQRMIDLVNNLQSTYRERIKSLDWMSDSTKPKAIDKLNAFMKKIGYPDKWKDYSSIDISRASIVANLQHIGKWQYQYDLNKIGKVVDRTEWGMTPPTVNAYYNPLFNEIVFPAGILQPPFFSKDADDAVNYGAIGAVIGHEMTHGFDDQGSQYDKNGNLKNWWTPEDKKKFEAKAQQVVDEYNGYTVLDTVHVNGRLTEGENIADIGGLAIAYAAFKNTPEGKSNEKINGLTPDQRFFMSFAQIWRVKNTDARLLWRINNDPHSPEMYRVDGPTSNMPPFYAAFNIKEGNKMYRPDSTRVHIW